MHRQKINLSTFRLEHKDARESREIGWSTLLTTALEKRGKKNRKMEAKRGSS